MKRVFPLIAALAAQGLALSPMPALAARCVGPVCNFDRLSPVFAKLATARRGRGPAVHILQIGDSHTAGDAITGAWRDLLQAKFGAGGRGVLAPGRPYDGYITRGVTVTMSSGWTIGAEFGRNSSPPRPPLGMSGFSMVANRPDATMTRKADNSTAMLDRCVLCAIAGPSAGGVTVSFDGAEPSRLDFTAPDVRPMCRPVDSQTPHASVDIAAEFPGVPILLIGAPDSLTRNAALRGNAPGLPLECEAAPAFLAPTSIPGDAMVQPVPTTPRRRRRGRT